MNFNNWPILQELRKNFLDTVEMAYVFGKKGGNALLSTTDGRIYGIGENTGGCLGLGYSSPHGLPSEIKLSKQEIKGLVSGGDGEGKIFLIAYFDSGEILWWGSVPFPINRVITTPEKLSIDFEIRVKTVACGARHCAVLSEDGKVFTCGENDFGQLGHQAFTKQVVVTEVWEVECGDFVDKKTDHFGTPTLNIVKGVLEDQTVIDVSCGYEFSVALLADGRVAAWGNNDYGQLGINTSGGSSGSPIELVSLSIYYEAIIERIVCGNYHVLALTETGALFAWGNNYQGQMGIPGVPECKKGCPLEVKVDGVRFIDIGASYLCNISVAQCANGKVYFWGGSTRGCFGEPTEAVEYESINDAFVSLATPKVMVQPMRRLEISKEKFSKLEATQEMTLLETLKNEFNNPDSSDLRLIVDGKVFYAHQNILKMRSNYFNVLITRWLEENKRVLEIKEKSCAAIEAYLKYLYTDNLEVDLNLAVELFQLADEYGDNKLKNLCLHIILRDMKADGVADIFADTRNIDNYKLLNRFSLEFALRHAREVMNSPGFKRWDADAMRDFVLEYVKVKGNCL